jgi:hypothetical protein
MNSNTNIGDEFAGETYATIQELVKVADAKATALIALQGLVLVLFGSNLIDEIARALKTSGPVATAVGVTALLTLGLTVGSMLMGVGVLVPRDPEKKKAVRKPSQARGLLWLSGLEPYETEPDAYVIALGTTTTDQRLADRAFENLKVAWILRRKFWFLKLSIWSLVVSVLFWAALIILTAVFIVTTQSNN